MGTEERQENKFYLPSEGEYDSEASYHAVALESEADALSKGKTVIYIAASTGDIEELKAKKEKKDVIDVIQNRVQLYLNEHF